MVIEGNMRNKTHEEFVIEIEDKYPEKYEVLGEYTGNSSRIKIKCKKCGYVWTPLASNILYGYGCPACKNKAVFKGVNDLETLRPDIAQDWDYGKNTKLPSDFTYGSDKRVSWKCHKCGYKWEDSIYNRVFKNIGCQDCEGRVLKPGVNDFKTLYSQIAKGWNYDKNKELTPENFFPFSNKRVWWKCSKCGHEWNCKISDRVISSTNCPVCAGRVIVTGINDFESNYPEIASEWHPTKNGNCKPYLYTKKSNKKAWWKCAKCGYEWEATIKNRVNGGTGCPKCKKSKGEIKIHKHLIENNISCSLQCSFADCRDKHALPFDFAILNEYKKVIGLIEYDGEQHYKAVEKFGGQTALESNKRRDMIKTEYCRANNIPLLRIPYWDFDN